MFKQIFRNINKSKAQVFFVRGFQRSGTNWVCNLLNLHPEITCVGEFHLKDFFSAQAKFLNVPFIANKADVNWINNEFISFIEQIIKKHAGYNVLCGDRTPCALSGMIIENKKYVLIHRDGRDCMVSWVYHLLRRGENLGADMKAKKALFMSDENYFEEHKNELLNRYWIKKVASSWNLRVKQDFQTMQQVDKGEIDIHYHFIKYEDLLVNTEQFRNELYLFLGLKSDKAEALNDNTTPGFELHRPMQHNRIGIAGRWKEYFSEELLNCFEQHAIDALKLLNYPIYTIKV